MNRSLMSRQLTANLEHGQGLKVPGPEEIAFRKGWISTEHLRGLAAPLAKTAYGQYLLELADETEQTR